MREWMGQVITLRIYEKASGNLQFSELIFKRKVTKEELEWKYPS